MVTSHIFAKYVLETNMPLKCYICQLLYVQKSENYDSIYTLQTQCNQQCHHKHLYTYIPAYWHTPMNKYVCHIVCVHPNALIMYSTCGPHITAYRCLKKKQVSQ